MNHVLPNFVPTRYAMWHRGYFCPTFIPRHWLKSLHQGSSDHPRSKKKSRMKRCKNNWNQITRNTTIDCRKFIFFCYVLPKSMCSFHVPLNFVPSMPFGVELYLSHRSLSCVYAWIQSFGPRGRGGFINHQHISSRGIPYEMVKA